MFEDRIEARGDGMFDFERKMAAATSRRGTRIKVMESEDCMQKKGSSSTVVTLYIALSVWLCVMPRRRVVEYPWLTKLQQAELRSMKPRNRKTPSVGHSRWPYFDWCSKHPVL